MRIFCKQFEVTEGVQCEVPAEWDPDKDVKATLHDVDESTDVERCPLQCAGTANNLGAPGCCEFHDDGKCKWKKTDVLQKGSVNVRSIVCED